METLVAAAVLGAAALHASWHALVKSSGDRVIALAGMNIVSAAAAASLLPFVPVPGKAAGLVIAGSVLLHGAYKVALARLYASADLSQAYPLARGITPLVATAAAYAFLGETPSGAPLAGIVLVAAGVAALVFEFRTPLAPATLVAALVTGASVAAYSVLDAYGVRLTGHWLGYTAWLVVADSGLFVAYAFATRGAAAAFEWRRGWSRVLVSGLLGIASFGVFMWALGRAQVGAVSALRETSVIFAALIGAFALGERLSFARMASAALVAAGVGAISLAR